MTAAVGTNKPRALVLFDVDGTLTESGEQCPAPMLDALSQLCSLPNVDLGVVGGGSLEKIRWQLRDATCFRWLFAENGLVTGDGLVHESLRSAVPEAEIQHAIDLCLSWIAATRLPFKRGKFVDFRNGLFYVTPIGSQCNRAERERFARLDASHGFRLKLLRQLRSDQRFAQHFECLLGGQLGVAVYPCGFDKTYCLRHLDASQTTYERIFFVGDRCNRNGNDYPLYASPRTIAFETNGPQRTMQLLRSQIVPRLGTDGSTATHA